MVDVPLTALGHRVILRVTGDQSESISEQLAQIWAACLDLPVLPHVADVAASVVEMRLDDSTPVNGRPEEERSADAQEPAGRFPPVALDHDHLDPNIPGQWQPLVASTVDQLLPWSTQRVTFAAIAANTGRLLMLHGGAMVSPKLGTAMAYAAPGGMGKTTMCRTLGASWEYVTDETVGVLADGSVVPYPKPLSTRVPESPHKQELSPSAIGLIPRVEPIKLGGLVLLSRSDSHPGAPEIDQIDELDALVLFGEQSSALWALPQPLRTLGGLVRRLPLCGRLRYREASTVESVLHG